jgi:YD repeat-containing protein
VGRKTATIAYAVTIPATTATTVTAVATALGTAGGNAAANQRLTRYVYDEVGQLRFTVDNTGVVVEQRYDGLGRVIESRQYGQAIALNTTDVAAAVAGITDVRVTKTAYNAAGEIASITDALNKTESFAYNGLGQRIQFTDKLNQVWTYGYDAAGRQTSQTSPAVSVATTDAAGNVTITSRSIVTTIAYDALGNVTSRTENANASDVNDRRTTQYVYDNRGHQVKTIFPDAGKINETTGQIDATGSAPSTEITYDARGRATVQKDVRGNYSYKVYDALDRVAYEVDQEGYVTAYTYNGFGEQTVLRRYATRLNTAVLSGWSAGQTLTLSHLQTAGAVQTSASDRTLTTAFDTRGQKVSIVQSSATYYKADGTSATGTPTTQFTYNAYGELVKEAVLVEGTAGQADAVWAETYRYYDAVGRNDMTVDAEGYVTRTLFNARGEATETTEYARELATTPSTTTRPGVPVAGDSITGYDRTSKWTYDALGRKASETVVRHYQNADGSAGTADVATTFAYDAAGHVTGVTTDAGTITTAYDALGRATSVREPVQTALNGSADSLLQSSTSNTLASAGLFQQVSPYTTLAYDAFGNTVQVRRYANGWVEGAASATADNTRDQIQTTRYDRQGRAVWERDAENNVVIREYDAADNVTRVAFTLDGNDGRYAKIQITSTYDAAGRQITSVVQRNQYDGATLKSSTADSSEAVAYNAFGDITSKAVTLADLGNAANAAMFEYNNAGQLTRSNAETGTYRRYGYNLAGVQVRQERDWTDAGTARVAVTRINVDKLGRTLSVIAPSFTADASAVSTITQTVDRWGNVIQVIDARGYQSDYEYNSYNQLVRETRPTVLVVSETGARSWLRPTLEWFYDVFGRLVGTRDANGGLRSNTYDSAGRLISAKDALNNVTRYAYDLFGNQRYTQNALGYITLKQYDRLNRTTAIGDFMPNAAATARTKTLLQQYRLNQSGERLSVTDALGYTTKYDYDSRNQLLRSQTDLGTVMQYAYDSQGRKIQEKYPRVTDESTPGYWEGDPYNEYEPGYWVDGYTDDGTRTDRENESLFVDENTWKYDYFGRLTDHNDLSRTRDFDYVYDTRSGQLIEENHAVGDGQYATVTARKTTSYYANGLVRDVVEDGGNTFHYEYDAAGNRTLEETTFKEANGQIVHTITRTYYDSNNRIQRVTQDNITGATTKRVFHITYEYDAAGNRRHVISLSGYGSNLGQANPAPVYNGGLSNITLKDGVAVNTALPAGTFTDADEESLTYRAEVQVGSTWMDIAQLGLSIDATGRIAGTAHNLTQTAFNARIIATDPLGQTATGTFVFNVTNTPPVVSTIPTQTAGRNQAFSLTASAYFSDANGSTLTFSASGLPSGLSISSAGVISGTVASSVALGNYTITVTANDGWGGTVSTSFTLSVANSAPVAPTIANQTATAGTAWSYVVPAFTDPNGDALTYSATGMPAWMSFNASTRTLSGTPQPSGSWTVTITATDVAGVATGKAFVVTTPNVAPVVSATIPAQSAGRNQAWSYTIPAGTFSDANGDTLAYSVSGLPAGLNFNAATRVISGTPTTLGGSTVTVTVTDGNGGTRSTTFTLSVVNNPPSYNGGLVNRTANQGQSISWTLPTNTFTDPNGDGLSYTLLVERPEYWTTDYSDPSEPMQVYYPAQWVAASSAGLSINASTGAITGTATTLYTDDVVTTYRVMVTATDPSAASNSGIFNLTVNRAPSAYASTVNVGVKTAFSQQVTGFSDPDGNGLTYTATGLPAGVTISSGGVLSGTLNTVGDYAVQVTATDGGGLSATATVTLHVANSPPSVAVVIPNQSTQATVAWSYQVPAGTFTDPNGDALTYSAVQVVQVAEYDAETRRTFYYDDYAALPSWLTFNAATRTFSGTAPSPQTVRLLVTAVDPSNASASDEFTLTVGAAPNYAPVAPTLSTQSAGRNVYWSYAVPAFSDANGDALTYSASGLPAGITFNASTRTFSGTVGTNGSYTLTITANDGKGGVTSASFTLNVANSAPTAPTIANQSTTAGVSWTYTVPAFTDPNGDALTYSVSGLPAWMSFNASTRVLSGMPSTVGSWTITVTATDPSGAAVSTNFTVTTPNRAPTLVTAIPSFTVGRGQSWSYQVPAGTFTDANGDALTYSAANLPAGISFDAATRTFSGAPTTLGSYTVTVSVADGRGGTASTTFSFTCGNSAPVYATALPNRSAQENQSVSWALPAGTFTDANGDALTYSAWVELPGYWETYYIAPGEPDVRWVDPAWASLSYSGLTLNTSNGTLSGSVHSVTRGGEISYDYRVKLVATDPSGATAEGIFNISCNVPPTAPTIANQSIRASQAWSFTTPAFGDANGNALTYSASGLPSGLSFNASTRVISGTPTTAGTYTVTITANDGAGGTASSSFTITVRANTVPVAAAVGNATGTVNNAFSYALPAFSDGDGDALTYTATNLPPGLSFNASTRVISGTPTTAGSWTVTYRASDAFGGSASATFVITIGTAPPANRAPVVSTLLEDQFADSGMYFSYTVPANAFTDPDGNPLTYTASKSDGTALPTWLTFNASTRTFSGTPSGVYDASWDIRVTATDPSGLSVSDVFNLYKYGSGGYNKYDSGGGQTPLTAETSNGRSAAAPGKNMDPAKGGKNADTTSTQYSLMAYQDPDRIYDPEDPIDDPYTPPPNQPIVREYWFTYDAENRIAVYNGILSNGQIIANANDGESYALTYDAVGNEIRRIRYTSYGATVYDTTYNLRGQKQYEFHGYTLNAASQGVDKTYFWDATGTLTETRHYFASNETVQVDDPEPGVPSHTVHIGGWLKSAEVFTYDQDGRLVRQVTKERPANWSNNLDWYDNGNQTSDLGVLTDKSHLHYTTYDGANVITYDANGRGIVAAGASAYDAAGRATLYRYAGSDIQWAIHTYRTTFTAWDGYKETYVTGSSTNTNYRTTTNTITYDGFGRVIQQNEHTNYSSPPPDRRRYYAYNGDGAVQLRQEGTMENNVFTQKTGTDGSRPNFLFVHAAGKEIAELHEGTKSRINSLMEVNLGNYDAGGGKVVVQDGENLYRLAQRIYGTSQLWYVLAEANGLSDPSEELISGTSLDTPNVKVASNDANTFKPYNPGEAIGSTSPGLPYIQPPPKHHCNVIAMVLIVVVAVVVTVFTAGAAAMAMGAVATSTGATGVMAIGAAALSGGALVGAGAAAIGAGAIMGAAAIGGFMGSVASQAVGVALGVQDHFSLRSAVASGLTAGLTAGVGTVMGPMGKLVEAGKWGKVAASAAMTSIGSYAANKIAGVDAHFSWRAVAASAVSAVISGKINKAMGPVLEGAGIANGIVNDTVTGMVGSVVSLHTRRAFGLDDKVDYGAMAIDAFGNALANAAVGMLSKIGAGTAHFNTRGAALAAIDQAIATAGSEADLARLTQLRADVEAGKALPSITFEKDLKFEGKSANGAYDSKTGNIVINQAMQDGAGTSEGAAGLLGTYFEEISEWVADQTGIQLINNDGRQLDIGAVNGLMTMQSLAGNYEHVEFDLGGQVYRTSSSDIFQASVRLFTPDRILNNVHGDGVYYQQTSYASSASALLESIQRGFERFGASFANNAAASVGLAWGILEKGYDIVKGLAVLDGQIKGAMAFATLSAFGADRLAARYRNDFNAMQHLARSVSRFVTSSWGEKWEAASDAVFGGLFESWDATKAAYGRLDVGKFDIRDYFNFGKAAGGLVFEVVNLALTATGAYAAAKGAVTLGRLVATRGAALAGRGAAGIESLFGALEEDAAAVARAALRTEVRNGYTYVLDEAGNVQRVEGELRLNRGQGRNSAAQRNAGGADRLADDQGGHYIGRRFDGPMDDFNHFAQNGNFNNGAYRALENSWQRALENGRSVRVEITPSYPAGSARPSSLVVRQWIDGVELSPRNFTNRPGG